MHDQSDAGRSSKKHMKSTVLDWVRSLRMAEDQDRGEDESGLRRWSERRNNGSGIDLIFSDGKVKSLFVNITL